MCFDLIGINVKEQLESSFKKYLEVVDEYYWLSFCTWAILHITGRYILIVTSVKLKSRLYRYHAYGNVGNCTVHSIPKRKYKKPLR